MHVRHRHLEEPMRVTLLLLMTLLGVFPLDVILPSFSAIANEFTTETQYIAYSVSIFALGASLSQLFIGPISDTIGRKSLLLAGLLLSAASAIGCLLVSSFEAFMLFRLFQAIGCGCFVLSHALVQDLYTGKQRTRMRILLTSASGLFISLSPLAGSLLQNHFNWQGSFALFAMLAVCCTLMTLKYLQETTAPARQTGLIPSYMTLMEDRAFMTLTLFPAWPSPAIFHSSSPLPCCSWSIWVYQRRPSARYSPVTG